MTLIKAIKNLNALLKKHDPTVFNPTWILKNAPNIYAYIFKNVRTENNNIDWDTVTSFLQKRFQKRWVRYRHNQTKPYEDQSEVDLILDKHRDKLYILIVPVSEKDKELRNRIVISLVRIAQKGNVLAQREIIHWIKFVVDDWIEKYPLLCRWRGFGGLIDEKIVSCIRCYRYTGTFMGYLFKTLEYSGRALKPLYSLDDPFLGGAKTRIDYLRQES